MIPSRVAAMERFHAQRAGATRRALARGRDARGRSSYQLLAELVIPEERVLDLGCGDGPLLELVTARGGRGIGVDRSAAELALVRPKLAVVRAAAAALPLADASFDRVLSHLAFSVMEDAPRVVAEIDRVLTPGGHFAAVVGGGPALREAADAEAFDLFLGLLSEALAGRPRLRLGDRRAGHPDGWRELWGARGYHVSWERHEIDLSGAFDEVWVTLASAYDVMLLSAQEQAALAERFAAQCARRFQPARIPVTMVVWLAQARKPAG